MLLQLLALAGLAAPPQAVAARAPGVESDPRVAGIAAVLGEYNGALRSGSARALKRCWDFDRMLDLAIEQGAPEPPERERKLFVAGLAAGFCQQQARTGDDQSWDVLEVRAIAPGPRAGEVLVTTRARRLGGTTFARWWLTSASGSWRVFDSEDLDVPIRFSTATALLLDPTGAERAAAFAVIRAVQEASDAVLIEDYTGALEILEESDHAAAPELFRAIHAVIEATALGKVGRTEEALAANDRAFAYSAEIPVLLFQRATLLNDLGAHEQALHMARSYEERLGPDADTHHQIGLALYGLGRDEEARDAFRAGLADWPDSPENLFALADLLEGPAAAEIGEHYGRLSDPSASFGDLAWFLLDAGALDALDALVLAHSARAPEDPSARYWRAEALVARGLPWEAVQALGTDLPPAADDGWRDAYLDNYVLYAVEAGRALEAELASPDREATLPLFASFLLEEGELESVLTVVERRRELAPLDPWLAYWEGQALALDPARRERGLEMLAAGHAAAADEGIAEAYRELRVATLFHSGRAADAWSTVEPLAPSRAQVLELCLYGGDVQALDEVVRLWTAAEPSSVDLARWRAHRDFLIGDYARCAESIVARGLLGELDEPIALRLEGDLVRASLRLGRFDDAMAHARRSTERDGDPYYEILVMAARGDVRATCTALERAIDRGYESTVFYGDEDLGPLLLGDAYASFRERYPLDSWAGAFAPPAPRHGEG